MSDPQEGVQQASTPEAAATQDQIPKYRLDEVLARNRALEQQLQVQNQLLRQAVPPRMPQAPVEEPAHWKEIKETNPGLYQELKSQQMALKKQNATNFMILDNQDKNQFLQELGDVGGRERLQDVELKLEELRSKGIFTYNRAQVFALMTGIDNIAAKRKPPTAAPTAQSQAPAQPAAAPGFFPGQDPSAASSPQRTGSALSPTQLGRKETLEELEARLNDFKF